MIDTETAAVACAVTPATIRAWVRTGRLRSHAGLFDPADLARIVRQREIRPETRAAMRRHAARLQEAR